MTAWRAPVDDLRAQIRYYFNPPDQAVFQPVQSTQQDAINAIVSATMQAYTLCARTSTSPVTTTQSTATPQRPDRSGSTPPTITPAALAGKPSRCPA